MGTSVDFGLALVGYLCGEDAKEELRKNIRFGAL
jgi:4-methyl-5(b-hydroxyethyl)-thiazole monophosphate biosynthesis